MSARDSYEAMAQSGFAEVQSHLSAMAASVQNALAAGRADAERLLLAAQSKHDEALHRLELLKRASDGSACFKSSESFLFDELAAKLLQSLRRWINQLRFILPHLLKFLE